MLYFRRPFGDLSEWLKEHAWKVCIPLKGIEGSNPSVSAEKACLQAFLVGGTNELKVCFHPEAPEMFLLRLAATADTVPG